MEETRRRLTAIVAVDVVGYSRLMGADEAGTLARLKRHRAGLIDPLIGTHGGRTVKTMGDGLLLEFPSIVAATEFAIAMQTGIAGETAADGAPMRFRVGVHLGDVISEDDDIFGDGVNVAARIEGLSEPGGVCLSDDAYRMVRDRLDAAWRDGGEHAAKNIARPIRVWHWNAAKAEAEPPAPAGGAALALPDKPSVAVLPFDHIAGDPEQTLFADGLTEDLITDLSKVSGLFVVARNSSFAFRGKAVDVREAARQLGVRHIVEGSVRKAGRRVRINVQLIDAQTGGHIWAERYDGALDDVFELQDEVGAQVVAALSVRLSGEEDARLRRVHTQSLEAHELYVRAKATPYPPVPDRIEAARAMFEQVIGIDPDFAGGHAGLAWMLAFRAFFGPVSGRAAAGEAAEIARRGIQRDESFGWSYVALAIALMALARHGDAIEAIERAVERQPGDADAHAYRAILLGLAGRPEEGLGSIDHAIRLNPQFIQGPYLNLRCMILTMAGEHERALAAFRENLARGGPVGPPVLAYAAAANEALGHHDDAAGLASNLVAGFPSFRLSEWNFLQLLEPAERRQRITAMMAAAGLPG